MCNMFCYALCAQHCHLLIQAVCICLFLLSVLFLCHSFLLPLSSHFGARGARRPERENPEDHRLRSGQGVASDHQDECGGDVRLDGPGGHQAVPLLQEQRCVEVLHPCFLHLMCTVTDCTIFFSTWLSWPKKRIWRAKQLSVKFFFNCVYWVFCLLLDYSQNTSVCVCWGDNLWP